MQVALDARDQPQSHGIPARVVSMPCVEWFAAQDLASRDAFCRPASGAGQFAGCPGRTMTGGKCAARQTRIRRRIDDRVQRVGLEVLAARAEQRDVAEGELAGLEVVLLHHRDLVAAGEVVRL